MLSAIEGLTAEYRSMVLGQNAIRFFGLKTEDLPTSSVAGHVLAV